MVGFGGNFGVKIQVRRDVSNIALHYLTNKKNISYRIFDSFGNPALNN
jgi:hypothetical protein